jgi:hypothetical protein
MSPAISRRLRSFKRMLILGSSVLAIASVGPRAAGAEADTASMLSALPAQSFDLVLLRPLGAFRLAAGTLLWVPVSLVHALVDMNKAALAPTGLTEKPDDVVVRETLDIFIVEPARYVFKRPLGEDLDGA